MKVNKTKGTKMCIIKRKHKFEYYKHFLEATQLESKINQLEKNKVDMDILRENRKEFIKNMELKQRFRSKKQQRFRSKKHNEFTEEVTKAVLRANKDKKNTIKRFNKTYPHGTTNIQYVKKKKN